VTTDGRLPSVPLPPGDHLDHDEHPTGPSAALPAEADDSDLVPDESPVALRRELRRRIGNPHGSVTDPGPGSRPPTDTGSGSTVVTRTGSGPWPTAEPAPVARPGAGGRHSRRDTGPRPPRLDYVPRHAVRTPGPGADAPLVSPSEVTEIFSRVRQDPTERPRAARPESGPVAATRVDAPIEVPELEPAESGPPGKRVRVVLSQRKGQARPVRTVVDVRELTQVGEVLSSSLIRSQLGLALRIGGIALIVLGALPAMFAIFPVLGRIELFGMRLPWLLLGVLAYPFLFALGWMYSRSAERLEQVFADHIQD
jgi:hypothetical protein